MIKKVIAKGYNTYCKEQCIENKCSHFRPHEYEGEECDGEDVDENCKCIPLPLEYLMKEIIKEEKRKEKRREKKK